MHTSTHNGTALYIVRNARTKEPVRYGALMPAYPTKEEAKAARNSLMIETGENFIVSPGPAHKKWRGWPWHASTSSLSIAGAKCCCTLGTLERAAVTWNSRPTPPA